MLNSFINIPHRIINRVTSILGNTVNYMLLTAARDGYSTQVKWWLKAGAKIEAANMPGYTPLYCAARWGHLETVKELLANGAKIEAADNDGWTALHCAAIGNHAEVVKELLAKGANIEAVDKYGWNALQVAARQNHIEVIQALLENKTPEQRQRLFNHVDVYGQNTITIAFENGRHDAVALLQRYGAVLPERLRNDEQNLNDRQSTHEVSIHESEKADAAVDEKEALSSLF